MDGPERRASFFDLKQDESYPVCGASKEQIVSPKSVVGVLPPRTPSSQSFSCISRRALRCRMITAFINNTQEGDHQRTGDAETFVSER
jgi:hypothetical protein